MKDLTIDQVEFIERKLTEVKSDLGVRIDNLSSSLSEQYKELTQTINDHAKAVDKRVNDLDTHHQLLSQRVSMNEKSLNGLGAKINRIESDAVSKKSVWGLCVLIPSVIVAALEIFKVVSR